MTTSILAIFAILIASQTASASPFHGGYAGYGGLGGYGGFGGYGIVEEIIEPVIPVAGGLVDSFIPGSSYCGYGTYGPAYGGRGYPLELYGYPGPFGRGRIY